MTQIGLIPAHAGKTRLSPTARAIASAHPRSRGENKSEAGRACLLVGSSPLTRGKHGVEGGGSGREGLIPAHAGKTEQAEDNEANAEAHPRSRGENHGEHFGGGLIEGSSPLTRGKRFRRCRGRARRRLIPAHAGKTRTVGGYHDR